MTEPTLIERAEKELKDAEAFKELITSDEWLQHHVHELEGHFDTLIGRLNGLRLIKERVDFYISA